MGLLDSVLGALNNNAGTNDGAGGDPKAALIQAVLAMLANNQSGGLGGLLGNLQNAGLGQIVDSWIGTGQNQPISGEQVEQALGNDQLSGLAQAAGISEVDVAGHLSQILPGLVDHLTPNGQLPESDDNLGSQLGSLLGGLLGGKPA
ncbi:YidB family protein [Herbaspirillum sp. RV1423]|uniref:YidB family protein n=1 Tax=Herbaspirillum sp. RV1423 TaxID=1443993 RepID=UPI0004AE974F|nr:YidB family protein [Herbaspirillum sp. RV1423]